MTREIHEIMAEDPLKMTQEDISEIIAEMRKSRKNFVAGNPRAGSTKPKTEKQKQAIDLAAKLDLKFDL